MKIGEKLYFSPKYRFNELNWENEETLIEAFKDRVYGFYLEPAEKLNENGHGFASGLLCVATIDFLSRLMIGGNKVKDRFTTWLKKNISEFNDHLANKFYKDFRCGLVHEGRIKNCGQFSYELRNLVSLEGNIMIINPSELLQKIRNALENYIMMIKGDREAFQKFKEALLKDFQRDTEIAKRI